MNKENTQRLYKKYPIVFGQHKLPMSETAMCWGFQCGDGWYDLIDMVASFIRRENGRGRDMLDPPIQATQVKQKFGGLRFYINGGTEYLEGVIDMANEVSFKTCEKCGSIDDVKQSPGYYIQFLCKKCTKRDVRQKRVAAILRYLRKIKYCLWRYK